MKTPLVFRGAFIKWQLGLIFLWANNGKRDPLTGLICHVH